MKTLELNDQEFEYLRELLSEHGLEDHYGDLNHPAHTIRNKMYDLFVNSLDSNVVAEYGDLRIYEWCSGYEIEHIPTGDMHWMSDGVDMIYKETDDGTVALSPGTREFNEALQVELKASASTYLEAYFPEVYDKS